MSNEQMVLTSHELDAIGEVMNISMGAAATAISSMLDRPVSITTPKIQQNKLENVDFSGLEPAIVVKIGYVEGIEGTNIIVLRRSDMQIILNLLMGNEEPADQEEFEFDDMSMSAACEVMNQMMGASATALSEVLEMPINISTPESTLADSMSEAYKQFEDVDLESEVVAISFDLNISKALDTTFSSLLPVSMAKSVVDRLMEGMLEKEKEEAAANQQAQPAQETVSANPAQSTSEAGPQAQPTPHSQPMPNMEQQGMPQNMAQPQMPGGQPMQNPQAMPNTDFQQQQQAMYQQMMGMPGYGGMMQNPYGMPPYGMPYMYQQQMMNQQMAQSGQPDIHQAQQTPTLNVKKAEFPAFNSQMAAASFGDSNLNLLMNIPLEVSVVLGRTKRKIRDIMEFGQGTVVELDKQTGAPADIIVNGKLFAHGDVMVIDDNFGIRVTEIVGTESLLESLNDKNK